MTKALRRPVVHWERNTMQLKTANGEVAKLAAPGELKAGGRRKQRP